MKCLWVALALFSVLSVLPVPVTPQDILLNPQYDHEPTKLRVFTVHRSLILSCDISPASASNATLTWTHEGKDVREVEELKGRFEILANEHKFVIDRTVEDDDGEYACKLGQLEATFKVVANVAARLPRDTPLKEGESLWIVCRVVGTDPIVSWILPDNTTLTNSTDHILLEHENGVKNSALYIASTRLEDRGIYTCVAKNSATVVLEGFEPGFAYGMVRIRSKIAPLWPVCGILAQCFVLFVVLFIYEKWFHEKEDIDQDAVYVPPPKTKKKKGY